MKLYRRQFSSMGCPCEIGVFSHNPELAKSAINGAENEVHRLDRKYSHFSRDSFISQLQVSARQVDGVTVDSETSALLDYAVKQYELSDGLFDITSGRLSRLWHKRDKLPSHIELAAALELTGWTKLHWRDQRLVLPAGMQLELGGLVKEYAADRAALLLKRNNIHSAFVELGGDIHVTGPRADDRPWNMGIRKPEYRSQKNYHAIADIPISAGGLATSGDYERSSQINGKRYGHIINPKTGWPVSSFQSVSVLAPTCLLAGSMSTLAMLLGVEAGLDELRNSGLAWLAQTTDGFIHTEDCEITPDGVSYPDSSYGRQKIGQHHPSSG